MKNRFNQLLNCIESLPEQGAYNPQNGTIEVRFADEKREFVVAYDDRDGKAESVQRVGSFKRHFAQD